MMTKTCILFYVLLGAVEFILAPASIKLDLMCLGRASSAQFSVTAEHKCKIIKNWKATWQIFFFFLKKKIYLDINDMHFEDKPLTNISWNMKHFGGCKALAQQSGWLQAKVFLVCKLVANSVSWIQLTGNNPTRTWSPFWCAVLHLLQSCYVMVSFVESG